MAGKIFDPTKPGNALGDWLNAYTCIQECSADAADNSEIKRSVDDNIKLLQSRVKEGADPQAKKLLETQLMVKRQMWARRPEIHNAFMDLWKKTMQDIKSYSWDLSEDVHYAESYKGGPINFWQGDPDDRGPTGKIPVSRDRAILIIRFLKFVSAESERMNPIEYSKQMLMKQGINKDNFHLYADLIAFPNPWTVAP